MGSAMRRFTVGVADSAARGFRRETPAGTGSGEREAPEAIGRFVAGCGCPDGGSAGKILSPQAGRADVAATRAKTNLSERRACGLMGMSRTVLRYVARPTDNMLLRRLIELAGERRRFGSRRLNTVLEPERFEADD